MFEQFFLSVQQDIKLFLYFPILCAIFRALFIAVHKPYPSLKGKSKALFQCFRFGFWWGMDVNAYIYPLSLFGFAASRALKNIFKPLLFEFLDPV